MVPAPHTSGQLDENPPGADGRGMELTLVGLDPIVVVVTEGEIISDGAGNFRLLERLVLPIDLPAERRWASSVPQAS